MLPIAGRYGRQSETQAMRPWRAPTVADQVEKLTLRQLRFFLAVVDAGGFTAAARHLYVSQPSISNAIAELERALGTALLVRRARLVFPTSDGEVLAAQARRILGLVDETIDLVGDTGGGRGGA